MKSGRIHDNAIVEGEAYVRSSEVCGNAKVGGNAVLVDGAAVGFRREVTGGYIFGEVQEKTRKFELTDETKVCDYYPDRPCTVYRIRALKDMPAVDVVAGDLGGYVEDENNLSHKGFCWVDGAGCVIGRARVEDNAFVQGHATVADEAVVKGYAVVDGTAVIAGKAVVDENAIINEFGLVMGEARVKGQSVVVGHALVTDKAQVLGTSMVRDQTIVGGHAWVKDSVVKDNAKVGGEAVLSESFVNGDKKVCWMSDKKEHVKPQAVKRAAAREPKENCGKPKGLTCIKKAEKRARKKLIK